MTEHKLNDLRVFLCHTSKDKEFVRKLANDLWDFDVIPWLDEWTLEPGDSLHEKIGEALEQCSFVGVVLSPNSVQSTWVKKELRQALSREDRTGIKMVIPILYRTVALPPFLEDKVYIDFEKSYFCGLARLVAFVHKLDKRTLNNELSKCEPKNIATLKDIAKRSGWHSQIVSDTKVYRAIQRLFEKRGIKVSPDVFRILVNEQDYNGPPPPPMDVA